MLFKVFLALIPQPQSPTAAKLKSGKIAIEEWEKEEETEAYTEWFPMTISFILTDKITMVTIISKKTEEKIRVEDIFLLDIPFSSSGTSKPILTIFTVLYNL